jgi:hypothetical protein
MIRVKKINDRKGHFAALIVLIRASAFKCLVKHALRIRYPMVNEGEKGLELYLSH